MTSIRKVIMFISIKTAAAAAALGALGAAAFLSAPMASADAEGYFNELESRGLAVTNAELALTTGYLVCEGLFHDTGDNIIVQLVANTDLTPYQASQVLFAAVEELCPYHDHRRAGA